MVEPNTYECEGCGALFNGSAQAAFEAGWDTPERFVSHCTCPACLITATAWWKLMIDKEPLTPDEVERIRLYNETFRTANGQRDAE